MSPTLPAKEVKTEVKYSYLPKAKEEPKFVDAFHTYGMATNVKFKKKDFQVVSKSLDFERPKKIRSSVESWKIA
jgi:hypothetical protein